MPFNQKFDLVFESHWFFYRFFIFSRNFAQNSCVYTFELDSTCDVFFLDAPLLTGKGAKWRFFLAWDNNIASLTRKQKGRVPSDNNNRDYSRLCRENNFRNFKLMESVKWVNKHANGASATKRWWASEWSQPNKRMNHFDWKIDSLQGNKHLYENKIF